MILCEHQNDLAKFIPANQLELERLEQMLDYLNTHFGSVISLQELADQVHLSREVCCRLFKKMTGKTITGYLEEYRVNQSLPLVQSCQYSNLYLFFYMVILLPHGYYIRILYQKPFRN